MPLIQKPWGSEELLEHNPVYMVKRLVMHAGHRCSLQYHEKKRETIYVLSGKLKITFGSSANNLASKVFLPGESLTIPPGMIHRMEAVEQAVYLESSSPELNDVVRLQDDYARTGS